MKSTSTMMMHGVATASPTGRASCAKSTSGKLVVPTARTASAATVTRYAMCVPKQCAMSARMITVVRTSRPETGFPLFAREASDRRGVFSSVKVARGAAA